MQYFGNLKRVLIILLVFFVTVTLNAKIDLPSIISEHMVLQQQTKVKLWGYTDQKGEIVVSTSWNAMKYKSQVSSDGSWEVIVETGNAGGPYNIIFNDGDILKLRDIYLGEVWLCSGQSNMEMPIKGFTGQPVDKSTETIANARPDIPIRLFNVKGKPSKVPSKDCTGKWGLNSAENVSNFSATAYFFGLQLFKTLNIPIGLVNSSWGGSSIQAWMTSEALKQYPEISQKHLMDESNVEKPHSVASMLYNGMINPIKEYSYKGVIWYQGEANIGNPSQYESLFKTFVEDWRTQLNNEELPFYYVQIAPYCYEDKDAIGSALLRQAQLNSEKTVPNVGMVVTMDIGNEKCIHPSQKKEVGDRLAYLALSRNYGMKGLNGESPRYSSYEIKGNKIIISFDRVPLGLITLNNKLVHSFEVAGEDGIFYSAKARIVKGKIEVWNDDINKPVVARYGYRNYVEASVFGVNGLPVSSFITE